jgi:hypothetical protein
MYILQEEVTLNESAYNYYVKNAGSFIRRTLRRCYFLSFDYTNKITIELFAENQIILIYYKEIRS